MARVLIAGCGYVGTALGSLLSEDGHETWGLRRRSFEAPAAIRPIVADLTAPRTLAELPGDLDYVFYAAAPAGREEPLYRAAYVTGVRNLLEALAEQGQSLQRFFFVSSTSVYGQHRGEWVDETSPTEPRQMAGRVLLEAESALRDAEVPGTIVRFGGIYGPRRTRLLDQVRTSRAVYREGPALYTNRIHRDDCAGMLRHLMGLVNPDDLYLGVDCQPAPERDVLAWLAGALGATPPRPASAEVGTQSPPPVRRSGSKRCSNARLLQSGYTFRYASYREGYRALISDLR